MSNRKHSFEIEFSSIYKGINSHRQVQPQYEYQNIGGAFSGIILHTDLPYPISLSQSTSINVLDIYKLVEDAYNTYQQYISEMIDLDNNTFVLEPTIPSFAEKYRRIAIDKTCSIMIEIDPKDPRKMGLIQFLGPDEIILKYRILLGQRAEKW